MTAHITPPPRPLASLREIADAYDAFLIDLWGVVHDGTQLYAGAKDAIRFLHDSGKAVLFLSNAPRRAAAPLQGLLQFGLLREQFLDIITSGEVAFAQLTSGELAFGKHYYYLGPSKDEDILSGQTAITKTQSIDEADFILNTGFAYDFQPEAEIEPLLHALLARNLPLLCVNPDTEVVKQDGTRMLCAGWVAARYEALGGAVQYVGKPHKAVYDACFARLQGIPHQRILAIGDNLLTDIRGANAAGIDCLLITGGILKSEHSGHPTPEILADLCKQAGATPTYSAPLFAA